MTTATDQFLMFALVFLLAYAVHRLKEHFFPSMSAEECGYAPGSEKIPAMAWPLVAVAMLLILAFLNLPAIWRFFYE